MTIEMVIETTFRLNQFLNSTAMIARAQEQFQVVAHFWKYSKDLADFQQQMMTTMHAVQIGVASADVCNEHAPFETRLRSAEYLIQIWNPYPIDPKAKLALRLAGPYGRDEIRRELPIALLSAAEESVRSLKPRRIGRVWVKDAANQRVKISLLDLRFGHFFRALRTLGIKTYEGLALGAAPTAISREVKDSDACCQEQPSSGASDTPYFDDSESKLLALSPREQQLWELLSQGMSKAAAAGLMKISPSTARVLFLRIKNKLRK
jgi:hypothetical protein